MWPLFAFHRRRKGPARTVIIISPLSTLLAVYTRARSTGVSPWPIPKKSLAPVRVKWTGH